MKLAVSFLVLAALGTHDPQPQIEKERDVSLAERLVMTQSSVTKKDGGFFCTAVKDFEELFDAVQKGQDAITTMESKLGTKRCTRYPGPVSVKFTPRTHVIHVAGGDHCAFSVELTSDEVKGYWYAEMAIWSPVFAEYCVFHENN
jgi:hypothetical protein